MKADNVNRWLTLGANVGVVIGIVFLAVELQQNNELLQSQADITYVEMRIGAYHNLLQNDELLKTVLKAKEGEDLSPLESHRLEILYRSVFINWEWEYGQYEKGLLDKPPASRFRAAFSYHPLMRENWPIHTAALSPSFVQFIEENVLN